MLSVFPQGHSQLPLCLSQFCLCPLGVRLLSAQSPVPGISRRTREARAGVAFLGCSLASGFYPERANWLLWSHQTGILGWFCPRFYQLGLLQSHCSSLGCRMRIHRQQLLPQTCRVLQHVCVLGRLIAFLRSDLPIATASDSALVSVRSLRCQSSDQPLPTLSIFLLG